MKAIQREFEGLEREGLGGLISLWTIGDVTAFHWLKRLSKTPTQHSESGQYSNL